MAGGIVVVEVSRISTWGQHRKDDTAVTPGDCVSNAPTWRRRAARAAAEARTCCAQKKRAALAAHRLILSPSPADGSPGRAGPWTSRCRPEA